MKDIEPECSDGCPGTEAGAGCVILVNDACSTNSRDILQQGSAQLLTATTLLHLQRGQPAGVTASHRAAARVASPAAVAIAALMCQCPYSTHVLHAGVTCQCTSSMQESTGHF